MSNYFENTPEIKTYELQEKKRMKAAQLIEVLQALVAIAGNEDADVEVYAEYDGKYLENLDLTAICLSLDSRLPEISLRLSD